MWLSICLPEPDIAGGKHMNLDLALIGKEEN